jgi:periplasmic protein TonB
MENNRPVVSSVNVYTMTSQQILQSDFLDILFEDRNKLYGAYLLRKKYPLELMKALGITVLLVLGLIAFSSSPDPKQSAPSPNDGYKVISVVTPEEKKPEVVKPKPVKPAASQKQRTEVLTSTMKTLDVVKNPISTQDALDNAVVGNSRIDGPPATGIQAPPLPASTAGTGDAERASEKPEPPLPSRSPQFPGGASAWLNFLSRHLRPPQDMDPGEKRSCQIRFSVDEDGSITNFQVIQSGGDEFDNEVIRVLKKMPKWLPAIQNGKPASVSFTQPVTFVAQEE